MRCGFETAGSVAEALGYEEIRCHSKLTAVLNMDGWITAGKGNGVKIGDMFSFSSEAGIPTCRGIVVKVSMAMSKIVICESNGKIIPYPIPPSGTLCEYHPIPQFIPSCSSYLITKLNSQPMQSQLLLNSCPLKQLSKAQLIKEQHQYDDTIIVNVKCVEVTSTKLEEDMLYFRITKQYEQCVTVLLVTKSEEEVKKEDELEDEYVLSAVNFEDNHPQLAHAENQIKDCMKRPTQWTEIQAWERSMVECGCLARFKILQYENTLSLPRSHMQELKQTSIPINPFPEINDQLFSKNLPSDVKASFVPIFAQSLNTDDIILKLELPYRGLYAFSLQTRSAEVFNKVVTYHKSKCVKENDLKETTEKMIEEWWLLCPVKRAEKATSIAEDMYSGELREVLYQQEIAQSALVAFEVASPILLQESVQKNNLFEVIKSLSKMPNATKRTAALEQLLRSEQYHFSTRRFLSATRSERDEYMKTLENRFTDFCKIYIAKEMEKHVLSESELFNWFKKEMVSKISKTFNLSVEEVLSTLKNELRFLEYDYDSDEADGKGEEFLLNHTRLLLTRSTMISLPSKLSAKQPFLVQFPLGNPERELVAFYKTKHTDPDAVFLRRWTEMCFDIQTSTGKNLCDIALSQTSGSISLTNVESTLYVSISILHSSGVITVPVDCVAFSKAISFPPFRPDSSPGRITDAANVAVWCISLTVTTTEFHISPVKHTWVNDSQLNMQRNVFVMRRHP